MLSTTQLQHVEGARVLTMCVSTKPISKGPPACLMEEMGEAPVPPSWPLIWMMSAFAFATPEATVPMPAWATSFTLTLAAGAACSHMVYSVSQHRLCFSLSWDQHHFPHPL